MVSPPLGGVILSPEACTVGRNSFLDVVGVILTAVGVILVIFTPGLLNDGIPHMSGGDPMKEDLSGFPYMRGGDSARESRTCFPYNSGGASVGKSKKC